MSLFSFGPTEEEEKGTSRPGAGVAVVGLLVAAAIFAAAPLLLPLFGTLTIIGERRRVRLSRWSAAAAASLLISFLAAGINPARWGTWFLAAPAALWGGWVPSEIDAPLLGTLRHLYDDVSTLGLWGRHILTVVPLALAAMSIWWWWRSYALRLRGENEGAAYSNQRPVGWLDRRRFDRNEMKVRTGEWSQNNPDSIAIGIGRYGEVAAGDIEAFKKSILSVGTSRSGKTRMANSIAAQQVMELGSGNITIDFKGGDDVARAKAELARRRGVPFLHFTLMSRTGGGYHPPHPYAPDRPAHYDPLRRGNGASKAAMLLNSVPREGDAAVYGRKASEAVKLAYDIAALTGFDAMRSPDGHPLSGLAILAQMLDTGMLVAQGKAVNVDQVRKANPFLSEAVAQAKVNAIHSRIAAFELELNRSSSTLSGAMEDVRSTVASYVNDSAAGPFLAPGSIPALRIDLVRAILRNEIIVFSLPAQEYPEMAAMIGTMVLLDLQNAVATLRDKHDLLAEMFDNAGEDRPGGPDGTPWNPLVVQIEELGSVRSSAAAEAMLGLFNKSADVGIRPILSTQSLADIEAVDGTGVWLRQLTAQIDHLISFQLSEAHDAEKIASFSGMVDKKIATEHKGVQNNRTGLFQGTEAAGRIIARTEERTRIGDGVAQQLDRSQGQLLWISKAPRLTAVHTTAPEGPNNWYEVLSIAPVHEMPKDWSPFADREQAKEAGVYRDDVFRELVDDLRHNRVLFEVLDGSREAVEVEQDMPAQRPAPTPVPAGEPARAAAHPAGDGLPSAPDHGPEHGGLDDDLADDFGSGDDDLFGADPFSDDIDEEDPFA